MTFKQLLHVLILAPIVFISPVNADEGTRITKSTDGTVQINISDIATIPGAPVVELSRVLKSDPKTKRFRVNWAATVLGGSYKGTALYDRARNTVKVYGIETSNNDKVHTLYSKVTDKMLHQLADKLEDASAGNLSGRFSDLKEQGAKSREIR